MSGWQEGTGEEWKGDSPEGMPPDPFNGEDPVEIVDKLLKEGKAVEDTVDIVMKRYTLPEEMKPSLLISVRAYNINLMAKSRKINWFGDDS